MKLSASLGRTLQFLLGSVLASTANGQRTVTFRNDIAPVLYQNCTSCHHAGGSGPFPLTTYDEVKRFASVIDTAVVSRYMPPWLPEEGHRAFQGDRHMSADTIALMHRWITEQTPEGSGPLPKAPAYKSDWQLGPPDLILETEVPVAIPASGADIFTNVIMPNPLHSTHWVRAMEIQPGSPQVVHHANVLIDRTASMRRDHPTWMQGIPGMDIELDSGDDFDPDSHFLFWKPDSTALIEPPGMPWRLDAGNDLVLNLHLKPSGKPETTRVRIGLYFTPSAATQHPMLLQLEHDAALKIPAGVANFPVEDELTLPIAVSVLGIYPHAHYLARRMEAWVNLPNGARQDLLLIPEWDIDRQSVYRFAKPLALPAQSTLHMRYVYDNSVQNIRNPHSPPVGVHAGNRSEDEMAHFWLQVLPKEDTLLSRQQLEHAWMESVLAKNPGDPVALYNLAALSLSIDQPARSVALYERLAALSPPNPRTLTALGSALEATGDSMIAEMQYKKALALDPAYTDALYDLAALDVRNDRPGEAKPMLLSILARQPKDAGAHHLLAMVYAGEGKLDQTLEQLASWQSLEPGTADPHRALAQVLLQMNRISEALREQLRVVALSPISARDWNDLGVMEIRVGDETAARQHFARALRLDPNLEAAQTNLNRLEN